MSKNMSKGKIALIVWIVFSILYIGNQEIRRFQFATQQSYQSGLADAINQVIQQSQNCQPFPVFAGENRVELINTACLQQAENEVSQ